MSLIFVRFLRMSLDFYAMSLVLYPDVLIVLVGLSLMSLISHV